MAWGIKYTKTFQKAVRKLDKQVQQKLKVFFTELEHTNPRTRGKALANNFAGLWRYRIGDFRIICSIKDEELLVIALRVGHRSKVYKTNIK